MKDFISINETDILTKYILLNKLLKMVSPELSNIFNLEIYEYSGLWIGYNQEIKCINFHIIPCEANWITDDSIDESLDSLRKKHMDFGDLNINSLNEDISLIINNHTGNYSVCYSIDYYSEERFYGIFLILKNNEYCKWLGVSSISDSPNDWSSKNYFMTSFVTKFFDLVFRSESNALGQQENLERCYRSLINSAVDDFLFECHMPQLDILVYLSSLKYEGAKNSSNLVFLSRGYDQSRLTYCLELTEPISIEPSRAREIRKLMEIANEEYMLCVADGRINAIVKTKTLENTYSVDFKNQMSWCVLMNGKPVIDYIDGQIRIHNYKNSYKYYISKLYEHFKNDASAGNIDDLSRVIQQLSDLSHGTSIIITTASEAESETNRLCRAKRGIKIKKLKIGDDINFLNKLTSIDGAIMLDYNGLCYGIGLILDGQAVVEGDTSRGARYNSVYNYIAQKRLSGIKCVSVIISKDGMIDVIGTHSKDSGFIFIE